MAVQNPGGLKSFTASVALEAYRRVQLVSGSGTSVEYAGADEEFIGVTQQSAAADAQVTVALRSVGRTFKVEAGGGIVVGATIYGASNGRIDDTASGQAIGTALAVASGAGSVIEVVFDALATSSVGGSVGLADRYVLIERFKRAPLLNASLTPASADDAADGATKAELDLMNRANKDFELLGTNAADAGSLPDADGGVQLTTAGADGDGMIVLPHLNTNQSVWTDCGWGTDEEIEWECLIRTGSAAQIGNCIIWAGLKLTNTDVIATDAEQAFFRYENGIASGAWQCTSSDAGVDDTDASGVTVAAATNYLLQIIIDADRLPTFKINGAVVATPAALGTGHDLIPYIAIEADGAAEAKVLDVRYCSIGKAYPA